MNPLKLALYSMVALVSLAAAHGRSPRAAQEQQPIQPPCSQLCGGFEGFTVIVLPDTQCYTSGGAPENPGSCGRMPAGSQNMLRAQTNWIAANKGLLNIAAVLSVGDTTECGNVDAEWQPADSSYQLLDRSGLPYLLAIGNHDYDGWCSGSLSSRSARKFNQFFGKARYAKYAWHGQSTYPADSNENAYITFEVGADRFLALALEVFPRDAALAWAGGVLDANADRQAIIVTHAYLSVEGVRGETQTNPGPSAFRMTDANVGEDIWTKLASRHSNVIAVVNGHAGGSTGNGAVASRTDAGVNGNIVAQMLANYQFDSGGGNGYLRLLNIQPAKHAIVVRTYSPYLDRWKTDPGNEFAIPYTTP